MHLFLDSNNAFQDVSVPINKSKMVTQWFEKRDKKNINHVSSFLNHSRGYRSHFGGKL